MPPRVAAILRRAIGVSVLCTLALVATAQAPQPARALSLNRFPVSRATGTDPQGFFHMAVAVGDDYFDGRDSLARVRRHLQLARALGVRYLRCAFSWNGIEPQPAKYEFAFWDALVDEAARAGVELIPYVAYTPEWAAAGADRFWTQPPRDPARFADFMSVLAGRYRGRIRSWELWNESDNREYWTGSAEAFAAMVKRAAVAVRAADPDAVLVLGGMSGAPGDFLDRLVTTYGVDRYVDVIAQHAYPESWNEQRAETAFAGWIPLVHALAARRAADVWLNEMGYADYRYDARHASVYGTNINYAYEHTRRYAAEFLFKSLVMTLASGEVSLAGWYRLDDFPDGDPRMPRDKVNHHLGLTDTALRPKPAFFAMQFFNRLFAQPSRSVSTTKPRAAQGAPALPRSQAEVRTFELKDGRVVVTGWLRSSAYGELAVHSGMADDRRRERVRVELPCTAATVTGYETTGRLRFVRHPYARTLPMDLQGARVYVAEVTCEPTKKARDARPHP